MQKSHPSYARPLALSAGTLSLALVLMVLLTQRTFPSHISASLGYPDVTQDHPYYTAIIDTQAKGVMTGYGNGNFGPDDTLKRAELATLLVRAKVSKEEIDGCSDLAFGDLENGSWYVPFVCAAKEKGYVSGYPDGTFRAGVEINAAEVSKIMALAFELPITTTAPSTNEWYMPYVNALAAANAFPPSLHTADQRETRGEVAYTLSVLLAAKAPTEEVHGAAPAAGSSAGNTDLEKAMEEQRLKMLEAQQNAQNQPGLPRPKSTGSQASQTSLSQTQASSQGSSVQAASSSSAAQSSSASTMPPPPLPSSSSQSSVASSVASRKSASSQPASCLVGAVDTDGYPYAVAVQGTYAYLGGTGMTGDFQIFDISSPDSPFPVSRLPLQNITNIEVNGRYIYALTLGRMYVIDVNDPLNPVVVGDISSVSGWGLTMKDQYLYVASTDYHELRVYSLSNPAAPALSNKIPLNGNPYAVAARASRAYVVSPSDSMLRIFYPFMSQPAITSVTTDTQPVNIVIEGTYAYVLSSQSVQIFDISNAPSATLVGSTTIGVTSHALLVNGGIAYVGGYFGGDGIQTFDVSNPASIRLLSTVMGASPSYSMDLDSQYVYTVNGDRNGMLQLFLRSCLAGS
jgi:hypothetical protein